ncbi:MAG: hypothetical protein WD942_11260 [Dehalococcoidia bacterium]
MSSEYIDQCLVFSDPVHISVEVETYLLGHRGSEPQVPVGYRLAFHLGERFLSSLDYPHGPARFLLDSNVLDDPVLLALRAHTSPGRQEGKLRIVLAAAPTTETQEALIVDADRSLSNGMALWDLPGDQVGLSLGDRWFPAGDDVLAPIPCGPGLTERLHEFEAACWPFFKRILYGNPVEEVQRLLKSEVEKQRLTCAKCRKEVDGVSPKGWCPRCAYDSYMRRVKGFEQERDS